MAKRTRSKGGSKRRLTDAQRRDHKRMAKQKDRRNMTAAQKTKHSQDNLKTHRKAVNKFRILDPIPEPKDSALKAKCRADMEAFFREYLHESYPKPFSSGHKKIIAHLQSAVETGGKFLDIVYREFGKTVLAEGTVLFASAYGLRKFILFVGADHPAAEELLESIRKEWETNDKLGGDFPEIAAALAHSEGIPQRLQYQLYRPTTDTPDAECIPTNMQWTGNELAFPNIPGYPSSGVVIASRSILGRLRGLKRKMPDLSQARPDFVVVDDPQDDESCLSASQVEKRLRIITRTILNLSGMKRQISIVVPSTILAKNDVIDQLSNPQLHGTWSCIKIPFVEKWANKPGNDLWLGEYRKILENFDQTIPGSKEEAREKAQAFYVKRRTIMDAGCIVAWEHGYAEHEVSAIQHAYNKLIELGREDFDCEYQAKPPDATANTGQLSLEADFAPAFRYDGRSRGEVPRWATHLTGFIDVQLNSLFWIVCAWGDDFTGAVVDYGVFPEQMKSYFRSADVDPTLESKYPGGGKEGRWTQAFRDLTDVLLSRSWKGTAADLKIERLCIDANDGSAYDVVLDFCRAASWPNVMPWRSRGVGASDKPFAEYHKNPGDKTGLNWRIPASHGRKAIRTFIADVNFWKSFCKHRLQTRVGDAGCLTLPGKSYAENRLLADHCLAEYGVEVHGRGRRLEEWKTRNPKNQENHWWDGLVACAAQASACGCALGGMENSSEGHRAFVVAGADVLARMGG